MAFGDLLDSGTVSATSITNPLSVVAGGGLSVAVSAGDLVIAVLCQETNLTVTAAADNLGNTYTASNSGDDAGDASGRMFYSILTNAGTLNQVDFTTTASANNAFASVAVFAGPFSTVDTNPPNTAGAMATPASAPASGTLLQAQELVISWIASETDTPYDGASTGTFAVGNGIANACCAICRTVTAATTSIAHVFTNSGTPGINDCVLGTTSFKADTGPLASYAISLETSILSTTRIIAY